ncbi:multifunctional CCA addition/repair protein [Azonexus sp.]|uniref:multifunctional CCA addition/repair protein n=1 Tax=Azonexus sp. TaxID=1872668 RepID=UPI0039E34BB7
MPAGAQVFSVGGAVRDALLGRVSDDEDFVVVGASPEIMLAAGFRPVGKDFPVFLHPHTQAEYALARTERKSGRGYHGFTFHAAPDVSLTQDLARRDLSINAMARDSCGNIIDPFGGQRDLRDRVLRHVGPAFAEDPVRILRLARFAARFSDFSIAKETVALMRAMVQAGEVDHLVAERVWQELAKGLQEAKPSRMFEVLRECGALARLLPEVDALFGVPQRAEYHPEIDAGVHTLMVIDQAARHAHSLSVRYAALCHDLGKASTPAELLPRHHGHEGRSVNLCKSMSQRLRVPNECRELAVLVAREHGNVHRAHELKASTVVDLLERCDALRRPQRFAELLAACQCDFNGRLGWEDRPYPQRAYLQTLLQAVRSVNAGEIAVASTSCASIPERIRRARIAAVRAVLQNTSEEPEQT